MLHASPVPQLRLPQLFPNVLPCAGSTLPLPQADVQAIATVVTLQSLTLSGELYYWNQDPNPLDAPMLDLSCLAALHRLRKLDLQALKRTGSHHNLVRLHLGGNASSNNPGGSGAGGGADSGCSGRGLPDRLEELLLPQDTQLDDPSMHMLAGLRHLTRLSAVLGDSLCSAVKARPLPPLTATLQQVELRVVSLAWHAETPICILQVVAGLLAAKPPAALRLTLDFDDVFQFDGTTALKLLRLRGIAESVREVELLSILCYGLQVSCWLPGLGWTYHAHEHIKW